MGNSGSLAGRACVLIILAVVQKLGLAREAARVRTWLEAVPIIGDHSRFPHHYMLQVSIEISSLLITVPRVLKLLLSSPVTARVELASLVRLGLVDVGLLG